MRVCLEYRNIYGHKNYLRLAKDFDQLTNLNFRLAQQKIRKMTKKCEKLQTFGLKN